MTLKVQFLTEISQKLTFPSLHACQQTMKPVKSAAFSDSKDNQSKKFYIVVSK